MTGAAAAGAARTLPACPICSGTRSETLTTSSRFEPSVGYVVCTGCGLVRRDPPLTRETLGEIYTSGRYFDRNVPAAVDPRDYARLVRDRAAADEGRVSFVGRSLDVRRGGRVLEVGSGVGSLLRRFADLGWTALGIEPDPGMCAYARDVLGLEVRQGVLEDQRLEPGSFDLVVLSHVFEHLIDPVAAARAIGPLLSEHGRLFVEVPNMLDLWTVHRDWTYGFDSTHTYNFTRRTLATMLGLAGFHVTDARETHVVQVLAAWRPDVAAPLEYEDHRRVSRAIRRFRVVHPLRTHARSLALGIAEGVGGERGGRLARRAYRAARRVLGMDR